MNNNQLKAKIIKDNLMFSLLELGTNRTIDLLREACIKIYNEGGTEVGSLPVHLDAELWLRDSWVLEDVQKKLNT